MRQAYILNTRHATHAPRRPGSLSTSSRRRRRSRTSHLTPEHCSTPASCPPRAPDIVQRTRLFEMGLTFLILQLGGFAFFDHLLQGCYVPLDRFNS